MPQSLPEFFEFENIRFYPKEATLVRIRDNARFSIRPKTQQFLLTLLVHPEETVTYKELWFAVWPEIKDFDAVLPTMRETKSKLDRLLREILKSETPIIQTVSGQGYCLKASITKHWKESAEDEPAAISDSVIETAAAKPVQRAESGGPEAIERLSSDDESPASPTDSIPAKISLAESLFGTHSWHVVVSCILYTLLYAGALLLEISYRFDRFGTNALKLVPLVLCGMFATSTTALALDRKFTFSEKANGLVISILIYVISAGALLAALSFFLPSTPITESSFQTYPAQAAYLKDESYFLILAIFFLMIPFHFIAAMEREIEEGNHHVVLGLLTGNKSIPAPKGALYPRFWALAGLLLVFLIMSVAMTARLLDSLKPGPYQNLFVQLVYLRGLLFFGLGIECLIWYYRALEELKQKSRAAQ